MKREFELDDLPAPGEPLRAEIHPDNQALLEAELAERAARARAKLTPKEQRRLQRRYKQLWNQLNSAKYNRLIVARWNTWQKLQEMKHLYATTTGKKQHLAAAYGKRLLLYGRNLNEKITPLESLADEFNEIAQRLKAHEQAIKFEREDQENRNEFSREAHVWEQQIKAVFRQSARLHYAFQDTKGDWHTRIPQIEQIIFKDDVVYYHIRTSTQTLIERMLGKWHSALPYNVNISDLISPETLENLSAACNRVVTITRSKRGRNLFYSISRLDSPDGIPQKVLYGKMISWYPTHDHAKTPWPAGVTNDRKAQFFTFEDTPHVLIAGSTKSGKSNHINAMIATLVTMNSPAELRLILIDNKGGIEFTHWQGVKHALGPMIKHVGDVFPKLQFARQIMEQRLVRFEQIKAKNLASFNAKVKPDQRLPRIVIFIDEMATLLGLGELTTDIQNELRVLSSQGRAVGLHIVVCTQHSSTDVLPGWVKTNLGMRISGKMPSHHASMTILDSATAATLPDVAGRMVFALGRTEVIAQSPFISDEEIERAVAISKGFVDPDDSEFNEQQLMPVEKFSNHDLLEIALNEFGGKLSPSRIHERLGNQVVTLRKLRAMANAIVRNEVVEHNGSRYRLKRDRNSYLLISEPATEPEIDEDTEPVEPLDSAIETH